MSKNSNPQKLVLEYSMTAQFCGYQHQQQNMAIKSSKCMHCPPGFLSRCNARLASLSEITVDRLVSLYFFQEKIAILIAHRGTTSRPPVTAMLIRDCQAYKKKEKKRK